METVADIALVQNGYVSSAQATAAGIPRRCLAEAVEAGELVQVDRGLYALPETWEDPYLIAQHRFAKGVFSDGTALYLHGATDRAPFQLTMTFSRNYNKARAKAAGIICRSCADEVLGLGVAEVRTMHGNAVRAYDLERTLCDMVRGQRVVDEQVVNPAMRAYVRRADRNILKLLGYARALGVEGKIQNYVRVLL
ncbi:hypothetical protein Ccur_13950 [Cryptobacterium curtum DSM 15641]|uniref:AbiEi antitoxin N-terminal domain-containing protein n=1 Tax=Cryptobacterium curtum (strain ATCC 700683 / DSM 15641 / CCUG 43107 / 12-3) TaxID=469378 RepID=C7MLC2_CRYCD|nr:type IV toxin-antitoxin system AbiEi family antitoxin domain-containing protein [Cryptobacterium curtum]ACU95069.1 hypothetical protein Ccur_13950 [Cryptobacterium curtum DSM 15641]